MDPILVIEESSIGDLNEALNKAFEQGYRVIQFTTAVLDGMSEGVQDTWYCVILQQSQK